MAALAGHNGRVTIGTGNTTMFTTRWNINWKTDDLDVTTLENTKGGAQTPVSSHLGGITDIDVSVDCFWDSTVNPFTDPLFIAPGAFVVVNLILDKTNSGVNQWQLSRVFVTDVTMDDEVRGVIKYSFTGKQSGAPTALAFIPTN